MLAFYAKEFAAAMNSILSVILFCIVQKGCHVILLQECLSLYDRIRVEARDSYSVHESMPPNFLLSIGKDQVETSGKVVLRLMI